jgi:ribulose-5-phosphate 4-epimerase/fuculose-1-phosphate aldolase
MMSNEADLLQARIDLAAALRWIARMEMHEGVCNHFTVMLPGRRFLINPKGIGFHRMTASSLLVIDENGKVLEGKGRAPTSGIAIHTRIHLLHPAAQVVLHLHAPYSTALCAIQGGRLQMIHQNAARFYGDIAYDDHFNGVAEAGMEGERMAAEMGDKRIMFMANHGVVVVAPTVAQALDDFYYLERACQVQVLAMQTGKPLNVMSDEMAASTREQFTRFTINAQLLLDDVKATLDVEEPGYAS